MRGCCGGVFRRTLGVGDVEGTGRRLRYFRYVSRADDNKVDKPPRFADKMRGTLIRPSKNRAD